MNKLERIYNSINKKIDRNNDKISLLITDYDEYSHSKIEHLQIRNDELFRVSMLVEGMMMD